MKKPKPKPKQNNGDSPEFKASLVYRASSRTARVTQRNPVSKKQNKRKRKNTKKPHNYFLIYGYRQMIQVQQKIEVVA